MHIRSRFGRPVNGAVRAVMIAVVLFAVVWTVGQVPAAQSQLPRTADGKPDLRACEKIVQVIANMLARGSWSYYPATHERSSLS
jgi:hypothetical protein